MRTLKRYLIVSFAILALIAQGCAGLNHANRVEQLTRDPKTIAFFLELDRVTHRYKAVDASTFRVPDFPYLRTNRFLEGMESKLNGPEQENLWIERMQKLDLDSLKKEIANLPQAALAEFAERTGGPIEREAIYERAGAYSNLLLAEDQGHPEFISAVKDAVLVPDEYSTVMRIFGLYPLVAMPVSFATYRAQIRYNKWHQTPPDKLETYGQLTTFVPPKHSDKYKRGAIDRLFDPVNLDAFGLPRLTQDDVLEMAYLFAPVFTQDIFADYDRFGRVQWKNHTVTIESERPTVYYYLSYVFVEGMPAIQMNYTIWYSARMGENSPRIERGPLDGLTVRITMNRNGRPVMADTMNSCGCYYFFIPRKDSIREIIIDPNDFAPLVPTWLPDNFPEEPINLRVNSGWHQVQHIRTGGIPAEPIYYELLPYRVLESLPRENGLKESVFTTEGIMKNSSRIEPYIFFSMGIPKVGYMRQRGHHAIRMVGREHFTNPHIYDRNFVFESHPVTADWESIR
jgi:hypothetical protein